MARTIPYHAALSVIGLALLPSIAAAADYAGSFDGPQIAVVIAPDGATYGGEIRMGEQKFPLKAHEDGDHMIGAFTSAGNDFNFSATRQGDDLTFTTGGATYHLHRNPNPLAGGAAPATAPSAQNADPLANYVVMNKTDAGRSIVREFPKAKTTTAALQVVFPDLARYFGGKPTIVRAYEDQKDHKSVYVNFSAQLNSQAINGFVTAKMRDKGAVVFVLFGKANASREEWAALAAAPKGTDPKAAGQPAAKDDDDIKAQMAAVPLTPYTFPDNTGAVGIAQGWKTNAQTESGLLITGPAGQKVRMALNGVIYTPDNPMLRQTRLNVAVAPYSPDPATALANIIRANSLVSQRKGGPTYTPEKLIKVVPVPAKNPAGKGAQITYDLTGNEPDGVKHYRVLIQFEYTPVTRGTGTWGYYIFLQLIAPQETFKQDLPVMMAQAFSLSENAAAVAAKSNREINAANQLAAAQRAANQKVADAHYAYTQAMEDNETVKMRSETDFDETIRGIRTIEDTQTGEKSSVDLADVHNTVDNLNYNDPGRYREIPLRDEFYPSAAHANDPDYLPR